jgi:hypothetical protein
VNEQHGLTFQSITPIRLTDTSTLELTPWYIINNLEDVSQDDWRLQARLFTVIQNHYQVGANYIGTFEADIHSFRLYCSIYL